MLAIQVEPDLMFIGLKHQQVEHVIAIAISW